MLLEDIRILNIVDNVVIINGRGEEVPMFLPEEVNAVLYDSEEGIMYEEYKTILTEVEPSKYQDFIDAWELVVNPIPKVKTQEELVTEIKVFATNSISKAIQLEIVKYNIANNVSFDSVHNAESYSRVDGYAHQAFCGAVWLWSVELWEFMRTWQGTLTDLPTEEDIINKIAEKPFVFVS